MRYVKVLMGYGAIHRKRKRWIWVGSVARVEFRGVEFAGEARVVGGVAYGYTLEWEAADQEQKAFLAMPGGEALVSSGGEICIVFFFTTLVGTKACINRNRH